MTLSATVIVGTYGDSSWADLARERAIPSAEGQAEVIHVHGPTLHEARNEAASQASGEFLVFCDADDALALGYVEAVLGGSADLRSPAIQWVYPDHEDPPMLVPPRPLFSGNYLPIGTAIRRDLFLSVGGFHDHELYEDWDLFLRCWLNGATIEQIPEAVYRAWWNPESRNQGVREARVAAYRAIRRKYLNQARRMQLV